jgi:eukaryotic-like serine/threonine-protein kinase
VCAGEPEAYPEALGGPRPGHDGGPLRLAIRAVGGRIPGPGLIRGLVLPTTSYIVTIVFVQFMYLPTLRALFALNAHDPAAAIQALQVASRYDLHTGGVGIIQRFGALYPIYVRGQAYLAARQPAEAAGEFQRILDHRSIVLVDPMGALARLQLARALALSGDTVKAKSAYSDLLTLWADADSDIPVLEAARAEYARLP